ERCRNYRQCRPRTRQSGGRRLAALNDDLAVKQLLAVEFEKTGKTCAANQERQPVAVVRPHLAIGDGIERGPERRRFIGLPRLAFEIVGEKDDAMPALTIAELKVQF